MNKTELLLQRLDEIGQSLKDSNQALALLALGSCGTERERLDQYSDLEIFSKLINSVQSLTDLFWMKS